MLTCSRAASASSFCIFRFFCSSTLSFSAFILSASRDLRAIHRDTRSLFSSCSLRNLHSREVKASCRACCSSPSTYNTQRWRPVEQVRSPTTHRGEGQLTISQNLQHTEVKASWSSPSTYNTQRWRTVDHLPEPTTHRGEGQLTISQNLQHAELKASWPSPRTYNTHRWRPVDHLPEPTTHIGEGQLTISQNLQHT